MIVLRYTHRDSRIGKFVKPDALDFGSSKEVLSEGNRTDVDDPKDKDVWAGKAPIIELRAVY